MTAIQNNIEEYLSELIEDKPSTQLKIMAVWDDLSIESQIKILNGLKSIPEKLKIKAFSSHNEYIRYLVVKNLTCDESGSYDQIWMNKVLNDTSPLVRLCIKNDRTVCSEELHYKSFFSLSHEERIMLITTPALINDGEKFAALIEVWFKQK